MTLQLPLLLSVFYLLPTKAGHIKSCVEEVRNNLKAIESKSKSLSNYKIS